MPRKRSFLSALAFVASLAAAIGSSGAAIADVEETVVTISSGRVGGLYYPVAGAICTLINKNRWEHGITCTVEITNGSIANLDNLRDGNVQLALAQADQVTDAVQGSGAFASRAPFDTLRKVFEPYIEHFTVVARAYADIDRFDELKGKRVYSGNVRSGRHDTMRVLMEAHGWDSEDVIDIQEIKAPTEAEALCDNEFDAFVQIIGHPNQSAYDASVTCNVVLVPIVDEAVRPLTEGSNLYVASVIPGNMYRGVNREVSGFGVPAKLVTTTKVDPEIIYWFSKSFFENLDLLREASPIFSVLTKEQMLGTVGAAPLHEGAERYFREVGLHQHTSGGIDERHRVSSDDRR